MTRAPMFLGIVLGMVLAGVGTGGTGVHAQEDETPFAEAELFFELNNTDGDLGIHSSIDGVGWSRLRIEDPGERTMLDIRVRGRLRRQGLTQLFFESTEPPFEVLDPEVFFARFPAGVYEISARTLAGGELESETELTHAMPAPPSGVTIDGVALPEQCDDGPVPSVPAGVDLVLSWDPVTTTHPELGAPQGSPDIEIVLYQIFVDQEDVGLSLDQDPADTDVVLPAGLLGTGEVKVEVLVREASHNQTATESCFVVQ